MRKILAIWLCMALLLFPACGDKTPEEGYELHYLASEPRSVQGEDIIQSRLLERPLYQGDGVKDTAQRLLRELSLGSVPLGLTSPLSADAEILELDLREGVLHLRLAEGYSLQSGVGKTAADYCIALTLLQLEEVTALRLYTGEEEEGRLLRAQDVLFSRENDPQQRLVKLYFFDAQGELTPVETVMELYEGENAAWQLTELLREKPKDPDMQRVLPEDFTIMAVEMEGENCYVDLSADSARMIAESRQGRDIYLSIELSLLSLGEVTAVYFREDGKQLSGTISLPS